MHPCRAKVSLSHPGDKIVAMEAPVSADLGARQQSAYREASHRALVQAQESRCLLERQKRIHGGHGFSAGRPPPARERAVGFEKRREHGWNELRDSFLAPIGFLIELGVCSEVVG